jgi:hypothetical protein
MNLYLLTQSDNSGWATFDGMVVAAESSEDARKIHPLEICKIENPELFKDYNINFWEDKHCWADSPENVKVKFLGKVEHGIEKGIIIRSYVGDS